MNKMKKGLYRHYKGKDYAVLGIVIHSESLEELVLYKALYDFEEFGQEFKKEPLFVRPKKMFNETIIIDGKKVKRFEFIKEMND